MLVALLLTMMLFKLPRIDLIEGTPITPSVIRVIDKVEKASKTSMPPRRPGRPRRDLADATPDRRGFTVYEDRYLGRIYKLRIYSLA
jgi:hypothetical protein